MYIYNVSFLMGCIPKSFCCFDEFVCHHSRVGCGNGEGPPARSRGVTKPRGASDGLWGIRHGTTDCI